jgi:hypothetical protein
MKKKRLELTGHVVRMDQERTIWIILASKPQQSTRRRRPRIRWLEDVEKDLWERKVERW